MQAELPKLAVAGICGTYLFHTSYATVGTPCDHASYFQEVVIERTIERILDNHREYGYPENPLTCAIREVVIADLSKMRSKGLVEIEK